MKIKLLSLVILTIAFTGNLTAENFILSTDHTSLVIDAEKGQTAKLRYYGYKISPEHLQSITDARTAFSQDTYTAYGTRYNGEKAFSMSHPDGNMSVDLEVVSARQQTCAEGNLLEITMKDKVYPLEIKQFYKVYKGTDIISTWVEITNHAKKPVCMYKYASATIPVKRERDRNWLAHLRGEWCSEHLLIEEPLTIGQKLISNTEGIRSTTTENPSFMISLDGKPQEEFGRVFGATLAWSGNYKINIITDNSNINIIAGINEDNSFYHLDGGKSFTTPEFAMTYSIDGKGGVSRAFHKWARIYKLCHGDSERDILLNSWEGVYLDIEQSKMTQMIKDISSMGGELFVMDDGWFGNKYPRDIDNAALGDWEACKKKLPQGISGLIKDAEDNHIKFGIWIEPEMTNTISELYDKHPDWVLQLKNRPLSKGRGGTEVVLDLCNPKVQDFVFGVVDRLKTENPKLAYIKWDANCSLHNYGSTYLPDDRQSQIYVDYHKGLKNVLERIRAKYPDLVMQACASGGGRVNYAILPYFDEFWTSDNTDALQRIYMQWGVSSFYPAIATAAHVSSSKNHHTGRILPLKFRFDVAMSGRLGIETQPQDMTAEEKAFSTRAVKAYKAIRPIVQFGDLYRLISPYDRRGIASLMYIDTKKDNAVLFAYKMEHFVNVGQPNVLLSGIDENKMYRITDMTPEDENSPSALNGKIIDGKILKYSGLSIARDLNREYSSLVLKLEAVR